MTADAQRTHEQAFRESLRDERARRGWRHEDLAAYMAGLGFIRHESYYSKIELGSVRVKLDDAFAIAAGLGLLVSQMTETGDRADLERELKEVTEESELAARESDEALRRAVRAQNRRQEIIVALGDIGASDS